MVNDHQEDQASGPTYKSIAYAACGIVFTFIGWWVADIKHSIARVWEHMEKSDQQFNERITTLESGTLEQKFEHRQIEKRFDQLEETIGSNTKTLRDIERGSIRR